MIGLPARLQAYLRRKAHYDGRERLSLPPFTLFWNPADSSPDEGVAIPDEAAAYPPEAVNRVCAAFAERGRVPCIRYLDAFAPGLTITLQLGVPGFVESLRLPVMYCTASMLVHPPEVEGLRIVIASSESPLEDIRDGWTVNSRGFDPHPVQATDAIAAEFRRKLVTSRAFTAYLYDQAVAAGMFTEIHDGITELVGITTLEEYRRRGIGAALTAAMTRAAFDSAVEVAFLVAANEAAGRVYQRLGYKPLANLLEYKQNPPE